MSKSSHNKRSPALLVMALLLTFALLVSVPLVMLARQTQALALINWAAKTFGEVELVWVAPELYLYGGRAAARELHVVSDGVALLSLYDVDAQTRIQDVLTLDLENSRLSGRAAVLYLPVGEDTAGGDTVEVLSYLGFLPLQLELDGGHVVVDGEPVWLFQLDGLTGERLPGDSYRVRTTSLYAGDALDVDLLLHAVVADEVTTALDFDANLRAEDSDSLVTVSGELASPGDSLAFDLELQSRFGDVGVFLRGLDAPEQLAGSLELSGRLRGDTAAVSLSELNARLDNGEAYRFSAEGEVDYAITGGSRLALVATGELGSVQTLLPDVDLGPGEFGDIRARLELSGSLEEPSVEAFRLDTRNEAGLALALSGRIASVMETASREGQNQLRIGASAPSLGALEPWLGELPWDLGAWRAEFDLEEVGEVIALENMLIVAGDEQTLAIEARGRVANVAGVLEEQVQGLEGIELQLNLATADAGALARWFDYPPLAGHSVTAELALEGSGQTLAGAGGALQMRGEGIELQADNIEAAVDLLAADPIGRAIAPVRLAVSDVALLGRYIDTELPALGPLKAGFELHYAKGLLDARTLRLGGSESGGVIGFDLRGGARDVLGKAKIELSGPLQLRDPALLESLTGLRMAAGEGSIALEADEERARLDAELRMGQTPLTLAVDARLGDGGLAGLELALASERLLLEDLGLQSRAVEDEAYSPAERIGEQGDDLSLAPMLEAVPDYPVSLRLRVAEILGENTKVEGLALDAESLGERLTLRRLVARSGPASIEYMGVIDRGRDPFALSVAGQAFGVPTGMITSDLGIDTDFAGTLSASTGLTAYGSSAEALVESLDGHFTFAVKDAVVQGAAYDVLATDLLGWIYKGAAMETETRIDCGMADFSLRQGVASSDKLYVETDRMLASGTAEFDLVKEYLDVTLTPLSKSRAFQVPSAVRLKGPFTDPQPEISPFSAAADAYAAWLTLVPQITLEIFGYKGQAGKQQQPCRIWGGDKDS